MAYLIKKLVKGRTYYYLASSFKEGKKVKRVQFYIGAKRPSAGQMVKYAAALNRRMGAQMSKTDPLLSLLSDREQRQLDEVLKSHKKRIKNYPEARRNWYEWFLTNYTYDTNAIEGSSLTLRETAMVLFEDTAPTGRPLSDVRAAENHKKAYDWMSAYKGDINRQLILKLHGILTNGILVPSESGKLREVQVYVRGASDIPPRFQEVDARLRQLLVWYGANKKRYHPVVTAAYLHIQFERIHPFIDFNGRTGRLLLNFVLMKAGYHPVDIRNRDRMRYYRAIQAGAGGNPELLVKLIIKYLKETEKMFG